MALAYRLVKGWQGVGLQEGGGVAASADKGAGIEALIESHGSMTLLLEETLNARVEADVMRVGVIPLDEETARYLGEARGTEALEREAVLISGDRRLLYARSVVPAGATDLRLLESLASETREPIGRIIASLNAELKKEKLERAVVTCEGAALDFALDPSAELPARRYILSGRGVKFKAAVIEIFNPVELPDAASGGSK